MTPAPTVLLPQPGGARSAKTKARGKSVSRGLPPGPRPSLTLTPGKPGKAKAAAAFARIFAAKTAARPPAGEGTLSALQAALKLLETAAAPEALRLEKALREVLEDGRLTLRQKAARIKALAAEAQGLLAAPGAAGDGQGAQTRLAPRAVPEQSPVAALPAVRQDAAGAASGPRVFVLDLRKKPAGQGADNSVAQARAKTFPAPDPAPSAALPAARPAGEHEHSRTREVRAPAAPAPQTPLERLREMAGSELTRAAGIILRDGGGGEIRLVLRPESLGSVRVRLNLTDNVIDGKIIVDNPAVKHIVEGSIDSLTRALSADGFQTASLQVSVGGGGGGAAREDRGIPAVRRIESARGFAATAAEAVAADWGDLLVNLFA